MAATAGNIVVMRLDGTLVIIAEPCQGWKLQQGMAGSGPTCQRDSCETACRHMHADRCVICIMAMSFYISWAGLP